MLESGAGIPDASEVYLVAVVSVAIVFGTVPAMATAVGGTLLYDVLFTQPLYAFVVLVVTNLAMVFSFQVTRQGQARALSAGRIA